jgi:hypothetical protein
MAEEEPNETPEPELVPAIEITNLSSITIQIHELYLELKKSGFKASEALTLTGMVLSSSAAVDFIDYPLGSSGTSETAVGQIVVLDSDIEEDDEEFGEWDKFFDNPDPQ